MGGGAGEKSPRLYLLFLFMLLLITPTYKTTQIYVHLELLSELCLLVSDQARLKPCCTATKDGLWLEISDLGSRGIVLSMLWKQRR